jgi:phage nucleotide-binding protein
MAPPKKLSATDSKFKFTMLLHSLPGAGKTTFIGTASDVPEMGEVFVLDLDGGKASLKGRDILLSEERTATEVEQHLWKLIQRAPGYEKVGTLVLDGVSELAKAELASIATQAVKRGKREDQDVNQLADYGVLKSRVLRLCRMAKDIPGVNVVFTAWSKATYPTGVQPTPEMQPTLISPDFTSSVSATLQGYVDMVVYLNHDRKTDKRQLVSSQFKNIVAKTRGVEFARELGQVQGADFVPVMEDPTFAKIVAAYKKAYK